MNTDWFFTAGYSHNKCEDYVAVSDDPFKDAVVLADGCSSVKHSDVGARLICHTALSYWPDLDKAVVVAAGNAFNLGLEKDCLCATLFYIECSHQRHYVTAHGDGYIVGKTREGRIDWWKMEYSGGAPWYPAYGLCKEDLEGFQALGQKFTVEKHKGDEVETYELPSGEALRGCFDVFEYEMAFVMSDGAGTFIDNSEGRRKPVPVEEVIEELVKVKNYKGEFMKRRCQGFLKAAKKKGWDHIDDFSVGAVYLGPKPTGPTGEVGPSDEGVKGEKGPIPMDEFTQKG